MDSGKYDYESSGVYIHELWLKRHPEVSKGDEIEKCPCCGNADIGIQYYHYLNMPHIRFICVACGCRHNMCVQENIQITYELAIKRWNRRVL